MGRQRPFEHTPQSSSDTHFRAYPESEHEIETDFPEPRAEEHPVFIAKMPSLEEPRPIKPAMEFQTIWNRIFDFSRGVSDRQQILSLWCVVAVLVCLLFWSFVRNPGSPKEQHVHAAVETESEKAFQYRSETSQSAKPEKKYGERIALNETPRSVRELEDDEVSLVLPTTSIDLSETNPSFEPVNQNSRYAPEQPVRSNTQSAWDRDIPTIPAAVPPPTASGAWEGNSFSANESGADFSALTSEQWGNSARDYRQSPQNTQAPYTAQSYSQPAPTSQAPMNRYDEPHVSQVQYLQQSNVSGFDNGRGQNPQQGASPYSQQVNPIPGNTMSPSNAPLQGSPTYGGETIRNATAQFDRPNGYSDREIGYQQGAEGNYGRSMNSSYNVAGSREEIPATPTNNTYRNPGTVSPETNRDAYYANTPQDIRNQPQFAATNTVPRFDGQSGQAPVQQQPSPYQLPQQQQYVQPTYGQQPITAGNNSGQMRY